MIFNPPFSSTYTSYSSSSSSPATYAFSASSSTSSAAFESFAFSMFPSLAPAARRMRVAALATSATHGRRAVFPLMALQINLFRTIASCLNFAETARLRQVSRTCEQILGFHVQQADECHPASLDITTEEFSLPESVSHPASWSYSHPGPLPLPEHTKMQLRGLKVLYFSQIVYYLYRLSPLHLQSLFENCSSLMTLDLSKKGLYCDASRRLTRLNNNEFSKKYRAITSYLLSNSRELLRRLPKFTSIHIGELYFFSHTSFKVERFLGSLSTAEPKIRARVQSIAIMSPKVEMFRTIITHFTALKNLEITHFDERISKTDFQFLLAQCPNLVSLIVDDRDTLLHFYEARNVTRIDLAGDDPSCSAILRALSLRCSQLEKMKLLRIDTEQQSCVIELLKMRPPLKRLEVGLSVDDRNVDREKALLQAIADHCPQLEELELSMRMEDKEMDTGEFFASYQNIFTQCPRLAKLDLNVDLNSIMITYLIFQLPTHLRELIINTDETVNSGIIPIIIENILKRCPHLECLEISIRDHRKADLYKLTENFFYYQDKGLILLRRKK